VDAVSKKATVGATLAGTWMNMEQKEPVLPSWHQIGQKYRYAVFVQLGVLVRW